MSEMTDEHVGLQEKREAGELPSIFYPIYEKNVWAVAWGWLSAAMTNER